MGRLHDYSHGDVDSHAFAIAARIDSSTWSMSQSTCEDRRASNLLDELRWQGMFAVFAAISVGRTVTIVTEMSRPLCHASYCQRYPRSDVSS